MSPKNFFMLQVTLGIFLLLTLSVTGQIHSWMGASFLVVGLTLLYCLSSLYIKSKKRIIMERADLAPEKFYELYFATDGLKEVEVIKSLLWISTTLKLPPEKLRPSDRFGKELGPFTYIGDPIDLLEWKLRKKIKEKNKNTDTSWFNKIENLDQLIRECISRELL